MNINQKRIALFDHRALFVVLSEEIAGDLGLDVRVLKTIEQAHPSLRGHDIHLENGGDLDIWRGGRWRRWFLTA